MLFFVTGFMGVGKTTIGNQLAQILQVSFVDLDQFIERKEEKSISDIFEELGEEEFRLLERKHLLSLIKKTETRTVIALGGGTICHLHNHIDILQNGICIYLKTDWLTIKENLKKLKNRPLIQQKSENELALLYHKRVPFYELSQVETLTNTGFEAKKVAESLKLLTNR
ncbi:MAG: shikimate kinase [Bacteroidia bacterium]|nr:shikimate kinase [Bacteroidia bacterium]NNJ56109.1 shikimate kinase [Bacteroidia bacterium]